MKVEELQMLKTQAEEEWKKYKKVGLKNLTRQQKLIMKFYNLLKKERKILDLNHSFQIAGLNENNEPKLAIARCDWRQVQVEYSTYPNAHLNFQEDFHTKKSIEVTDELFRKCKFIRLEAPLPYIPPYISIYDKSKFYVLWEVEEWKLPPKDPILLKKLANNFYLVVNYWNITDIENKVIQASLR